MGNFKPRAENESKFGVYVLKRRDDNIFGKRENGWKVIAAQKNLEICSKKGS